MLHRLLLQFVGVDEYSMCVGIVLLIALMVTPSPVGYIPTAAGFFCSAAFYRFNFTISLIKEVI